MNCPNCGAELIELASFCHQCGTSVGQYKDVRIAPSDSLKDTTTGPVSSGHDTVEISPRKSFSSAAGDGTDEPESDLWSGSYSPKAMIPHSIAAALFAIVLIIVGISIPAEGGWWTLIIVLMLSGPVAIGLRLAYLRFSLHYHLTSQRMIHEVGLLRRVTDRIEMIDVDDVSMEQGFIERFLGVGTIRVTSSDRTHPELVLRGIEEVKSIAEIIDTARRKERIRRGLHIESI